MTRKKPASSLKQSPIPDDVSSIFEGCLSQRPVIILGRGASMAHGIPGTDWYYAKLCSSRLNARAIASFS